MLKLKKRSFDRRDLSSFCLIAILSFSASSLETTTLKNFQVNLKNRQTEKKGYRSRASQSAVLGKIGFFGVDGNQKGGKNCLYKSPLENVFHFFAKVSFYHSYISSADLNDSQSQVSSLFLNPQICKNIFLFTSIIPLTFWNDSSKLWRNPRGERWRKYEREILRTPGQENALVLIVFSNTVKVSVLSDSVSRF